MTSVRFDHVSKQFTLHLERPRSFQELFLNAIRLRRNRSTEKFWALRDVSFDIKPGETVGIVGDNGVGKSTLLKLIPRIIEPSTGEIVVNGRVSALLELGAGFHPDLTGRENIYLNGSILGFSRAEMDRIFDDILSFSEMERFIDAPVKHYSSGMYMRLGFSIAIHVRPDVLIVDEILAVGDQAFQRRCLDKINEMKRRGITIILVSHDLETVRNICRRAIWLDSGRVQAEGLVEPVIEQYLTKVAARDEQQKLRTEREKPGLDQRRDNEAAWRWGSREAEITAVQLLDREAKERRIFRTGDTLTVRMHYLAHEPIQQPRFGLALHHNSGFHINGPNNVFAGYPIPEIEGEGFVDHTIESLPLLPGTYLVSVTIYDFEGDHAYDYIHQRFSFSVHAGGVREQFGSFYIPATWRWSPGSTSQPQARNVP
jgi:lipopolysaccharide transport system ATP-binding protein